MARILFKQGVSYRDAAVALWWFYAPYSVDELQKLAVEATTLQGRHSSIAHTEATARDWLEGQGRGLLRSLDRAWQDVNGEADDLPGLRGLTPLTRSVLSEWPADALATIESIRRRRR